MKKLLNKILQTFTIAATTLVLVFSQTAAVETATLKTASADPLASKSEEVMSIYVRIGCVHCAKVEEYIEDNDYMDVFKIELKEISTSQAYAKEFTDAGERFKIPLEKLGVPLLVVGDKYFMGDTPIIEYLDKKYEIKKLEEESKNPEQNGTDPSGQGQIEGDGNTDAKSSLTIPMLIGAALADAINPCEFAVLIILLTSILANGSKKRALLSGLAFSLAIFLSYLAMGVGLYSALATAKFSLTFMRVIGGLAIVLGLFNLKDFFFYGKGFLMEVPLGWRPKMKAILRSVTNPLGAFAIGIVISLFLLPCTSGPYVVVTSLLSQSETFWYAFRLLVLYNVIFVSPMIAITLAVYYGFSAEKAEEIRQKRLRVLHLITGLILLAMGAIVLVQFG